MNTDFGIKVYYAGQIGNQMFHYVLGKILAEKRELSFEPPRYFVDKSGNPVVWSQEPLFKQRSTKGRKWKEEEALQFGAYHWYDFDALPDRSLHLCYGHWCRYELYRDWKNKIRQDWLHIPENRYVETDPDAVYIHVRLTDFVTQDGLPINTNFQSSTTTIDGFRKCLDALDKTSYKRLVIITDDPNDAFLDGFKQFGLPITIQSKRWDEDFLTIASCRQLIMSNSTFSWWAAFLGRPERIICPFFPDTYWGRGYGARGAEREQYPNLYVDDEERWIPVF
jgi:hypothetical protein